MCSRVMDIEIIPHLHLWQHTINGKLVVVLAKRTCHIILVVTWCIFLAQNCDVVICAIHCRTHQIDRTGIHADVLLIGMLLMNCLCYQRSIRSHHETSHLCVDGDICKTSRY